MRYPPPDWVNRQIVENKKMTQKVRLQALAAIAKPSLCQLLRLLTNSDTPSRLMALAAKRYEIEILKRKLRKDASQPQATPADNR
jgi:hypothetical protein